MRVRDWMSPDPVTVEPDTPVREACRLLRYYGIRHLPVVRRGRVVGIVSDRDLHPEDDLADEGHHMVDRAVEEVMSSPVHDITDTESVEAAARLMLSRRVSALPVLDPDGSLTGLITTTDCLLASLHPAHEAAG